MKKYRYIGMYDKDWTICSKETANIFTGNPSYKIEEFEEEINAPLTDNEIKIGGYYLDTHTNTRVKIIDDNNRKPLCKYYCEWDNGFGCFRNAKSLTPLTP